VIGPHTHELSFGVFGKENEAAQELVYAQLAGGQDDGRREQNALEFERYRLEPHQGLRTRVFLRRFPLVVAPAEIVERIPQALVLKAAPQARRKPRRVRRPRDGGGEPVLNATLQHGGEFVLQLILGMVEKVDEKVALVEEELLFHEAQGRQQVILVQ
jgi:hypothetical protein